MVIIRLSFSEHQCVSRMITNYPIFETDLDNRTVKLCQPICNPGCVNGKCVEVNTCDCDVGYQFDDDDDSAGNVCEPHCKAGYRFNETSKKCDAICEMECVNADCVEPNSCVCFSGYSAGEEGCEPHCDVPCINAVCIQPNVCKCHEGYAFDNSTTECEPICDNNCPNGTCVMPDQCECLEGFAMKNENACEKLCWPQCDLGDCQNGVCVCQDGYRLTEDGICQLYCEPPCINGICLRDNMCVCEDNYQLNDEFECELKCSPSCINGNCVGHNLCSCKEGYAMSENNYTCEPVCGFNGEGCSNAACMHPGLCLCWPGYSYVPQNPFACELPTCSPPCKYGNCIDYDICQCFDGYENGNGNVCEPVCGMGCNNSTCVSPDRCQCYDGYQKVEGNEYVCEWNGTTTMEWHIIGGLHRAHMHYIYEAILFIVCMMALVVGCVIKKNCQKIDYNVKTAGKFRKCILEINIWTSSLLFFLQRTTLVYIIIQIKTRRHTRNSHFT